MRTRSRPGRAYPYVLGGIAGASLLAALLAALRQPTRSSAASSALSIASVSGVPASPSDGGAVSIQASVANAGQLSGPWSLSGVAVVSGAAPNATPVLTWAATTGQSPGGGSASATLRSTAAPYANGLSGYSTSAGLDCWLTIQNTETGTAVQYLVPSAIYLPFGVPAGTVAIPPRVGLGFGDFSPQNNSVMSAPVDLSGASAVTIGVQISFEAGAQPDTLLNIGPLVISVDTAGNLALSTQGAGGAGGLGVPYSSAYGVSLANAGSGWHDLLWVVPLGATPTPANTQLWIDRQQVSLQQRTATPALTLGSETLYVSGPTSGTGHWDGYVANLFVWDRSLTAAEAGDWFDGYAPTAGLLDAWPMDDGTGTSASNLVSGGAPLSWTGFNAPPAWL